MKLKAGTKKKGIIIEDQYSGSMAQAMEKAFIQEWQVIMGTDAPEMNNHVRLLFIAIAQGVIRHLYDNQDAITVTVPPGGGVIDVDIAVEPPLY